MLYTVNSSKRKAPKLNQVPVVHILGALHLWQLPEERIQEQTKGVLAATKQKAIGSPAPFGRAGGRSQGYKYAGDLWLWGSHLAHTPCQLQVALEIATQALLEGDRQRELFRKHSRVSRSEGSSEETNKYSIYTLSESPFLNKYDLIKCNQCNKKLIRDFSCKITENGGWLDADITGNHYVIYYVRVRHTQVGRLKADFFFS